MNYTLEDVSNKINLWFNKDPVRPELDVEFKTSEGRSVYGLLNTQRDFVAFICIALTTGIPKSVDDLAAFTSKDGDIAVPYSVWSYERGAGREIINKVLDLVRETNSATRVITLSPQTDMAKKFHLRNNAIELRRNKDTVNFEYLL